MADYTPAPGTCALCGDKFSGRPVSGEYCSKHCGGAARYGFAGPVRCRGCGKRMHASRNTRRDGLNRCRECSRHGQGGYKRGCRCDQCVSEKREAMRDYFTRHRDEHGVSWTTSRKRRIKDETGFRPGLAGGSLWIDARVRLALYERDNWTCHLCGDSVNPDADFNANDYPSLDHLTPRSLGGSDEPDNLRTAHRGCNARRGVRDVEEVLPSGRKEATPAGSRSRA